MGTILILTDDPEGGKRLARNVGGGAVAHDLYDQDDLPTDARLVIADVRTPHSDSIDRIKRALHQVRGPATPLLYLIHGNQQRGEIHAAMLGATKTLPAMMAAALLASTVETLSGDPAPARPTTPVEHVNAARQAFTELFTQEGPKPDIVDHGTEIVNRAIQDMKVHDWLSVVAAFDDVTHRHCLTVAGLAAAFASTLRFKAKDAHTLTKGALLHDIGKAKIPLAILNKPGPLTAPERDIMAEHAALGFDMLQDRGFTRETLQVVRSHHELLDGTGYPDGLRGDAIPDLVRLVTICDIFAALIERRPYKAPLSAREAYKIMYEMGSKLDQPLVRAFAPVAYASDLEPAPLSA